MWFNNYFQYLLGQFWHCLKGLQLLSTWTLGHHGDQQLPGGVGTAHGYIRASLAACPTSSPHQEQGTRSTRTATSPGTRHLPGDRLKLGQAVGLWPVRTALGDSRSSSAWMCPQEISQTRACKHASPGHWGIPLSSVSSLNCLWAHADRGQQGCAHGHDVGLH